MNSDNEQELANSSSFDSENGQQLENRSSPGYSSAGSGSHAVNQQDVRKILFKDGEHGDLSGCDMGILYGKFGVKWEKQLRLSSSSNGAQGGEFRHGHVFMRILLFIEEKLIAEVPGVDVTMEFLPSEHPKTHIVQVFNFNLDTELKRPHNDRRFLENLAFDAIMSMLRPKLTIIAASNFEIFGGVVGNTAQQYVCKKYKLERNPLGVAMFRAGGLLTRSRTTRANPAAPTGRSAEFAKRSNNDSINSLSGSDEVRHLFLCLYRSLNFFVRF